MELVAAPLPRGVPAIAASCAAMLTLLYADAASLAEFARRDTIDPG